MGSAYFQERAYYRENTVFSLLTSALCSYGAHLPLEYLILYTQREHIHDFLNNHFMFHFKGLWEVCLNGFHDMRHQYDIKFYGCKHILLEEYDIIRDELMPGKFSYPGTSSRWTERL